MGPRLSGTRPDQGFYPARTNDMLFQPSTWTNEVGLPLKARIPRFWDSTVPVISGTSMDTVCSFSPQCGPKEPASVSGCCTGAFCYTERLRYGPRPRTAKKHGHGYGHGDTTRRHGKFQKIRIRIRQGHGIIR